MQKQSKAIAGALSSAVMAWLVYSQTGQAPEWAAAQGWLTVLFEAGVAIVGGAVGWGVTYASPKNAE